MEIEESKWMIARHNEKLTTSISFYCIAASASWHILDTFLKRTVAFKALCNFIYHCYLIVFIKKVLIQLRFSMKKILILSHNIFKIDYILNLLKIFLKKLFQIYKFSPKIIEWEILEILKYFRIYLRILEHFFSIFEKCSNSY